MAVPKRKTSKARRDTRRAGNCNFSTPEISQCPQCHKVKLSHRVCKNCGYYDGRQAIVIQDDKKKSEA